MGYLEKIKYILRGSRYYRKYFQTTVNSLRYYFRDLHYYWQLYSFKKDREVSGNTLYFIINKLGRQIIELLILIYCDFCILYCRQVFDYFIYFFKLHKYICVY